MDEVLFEEFKGTGNMELQLDREDFQLEEIFPCNLILCHPVQEEMILLLDENTIQRMWIMRKYLAKTWIRLKLIEFISDKIKKTTLNEEFLEASMNSQLHAISRQALTFLI